MNQIAFGIDAGGTNVRMAMVSQSGEVLGSTVITGSQNLDPQEFTALVSKNFRALRGDHTPIGIGIGLAGTIFPDGAMRQGMTNLPKLAGHLIADQIETATGLSCRTGNDAQAAIRAEARFGAAAGCRNVLCLTLGTGIGSSLLLDGSIRKGAHGNGGEVGLFRSSGAGHEGMALEDLISPGGILRRTGQSAKDLAAAAEGSAKSAAELEQVFDLLGLTIANLHLLLDLEMTVLSGGLTGLGPVLLDGVRGAFVRHCPQPYQFGMKIVLSRFGELTGAIGAACLWFDQKDGAQ